MVCKTNLLVSFYLQYILPSQLFLTYAIVLSLTIQLDNLVVGHCVIWSVGMVWFGIPIFILMLRFSELMVGFWLQPRSIEVHAEQYCQYWGVKGISKNLLFHTHRPTFFSSLHFLPSLTIKHFHIEGWKNSWTQFIHMPMRFKRVFPWKKNPNLNVFW